VYVKRQAATNGVVSTLAVGAAALSLCGCNTLAKNNYFLPGGVDQHSAVAGQVAAAQHSEGPFPTFAEIPPVANDVRSLPAWRAAVGETLAEKQATESEIERHPWTLENTGSFAEQTRAQIPPAEAVPPADATAAAEAFAASVRGRAKTPPPHR